MTRRSAGQEATRGAACFLVEDGRIFVLRRTDFQQELLGPVGHVVGYQVTAAPSSGPEIL